jgi:bifunctional non-homologous end joining protein LigD
MSLRDYKRKRDFKKTAEPSGERPERAASNRFVIQKHAASRLHYDFRLEMDGTLKSWAVPKGIPFLKGEKRLAVQVEDHPIEYRNFEGTIPKGQYGGGTVMVWDFGTYEPTNPDWRKEFESGKLHFSLHGKKLKGEWYLVRLRGGEQWLLIRGKEDMRAISKKSDDTSAISGKSMKQISEGDAVWQSNRESGSPRLRRAARETMARAAERNAVFRGSDRRVRARGDSRRITARQTRTSTVKGGQRTRFVVPMKARLVDAPPAGDWIYEIKFDGFRALAIKSGDDVRLLSRNEKEFGATFPEVADSVAQLGADDAIIDGEIVALDPKGRSSFQLLQAYDLGQERPPIYFYAFDLLQLNGRDFRNESVTARKVELEKLLKKPPGVIRYSASLTGKVQDLLKQASRLGLEGIIGKRTDSSYEPGRRSGAWIKLKLHQEQEMVIGGFTEPAGTRKLFGAILVGCYEKNRLLLAGKVGTGFNETLLRSLHARFQKIHRDDCPFANVPEKSPGRYGAGITRAEMKRCHWIEPKLVCQIKFSEWTRDGKLRQPVFLGLREDKDPRDVVREKAS